MNRRDIRDPVGVGVAVGMCAVPVFVASYVPLHPIGVWITAFLASVALCPVAGVIVLMWTFDR